MLHKSTTMLQILWKMKLQNVAKTVEMAASSSKMLQIARKTGRKNGSNKIQDEQIVIPKKILNPY